MFFMNILSRFPANSYPGAHHPGYIDKSTGSGKMIRKLKSGEYRIYSIKKDPKTGKRRNLGTFETREAAEKHEREIQYFKKTP